MATGEQAHREVEAAPPSVDRRGSSPVGSAQRPEHQRRLGCRREIGGYLGRVVGGVLEVLVERRRPGGFLRSGVDLHRADKVADGSQQLARHVGNWPVRDERDALRSTVGVLSDCVMGVQVERDDQRAGTVGRWQRLGLPSASAEA